MTCPMTCLDPGYLRSQDLASIWMTCLEDRALYVYPYHARARGIGISAYLGTCPFPIHIGLRPLRATNHYLEVLHKRGVLCGTEFLRDSLGSMVRPKVSLFGQFVH